MHKLKSRVEFLKTIYSLKMYIHIPIIEPLSAPAPSPPPNPSKVMSSPQTLAGSIFLSNPHSASFHKARIALDKVHERPYN